jgi:hypothetical protein
VSSPLSLITLPAIASTGISSPVIGFIRPISPRRISPGPVSPSSRPEMNDEKWASLACTVR